MNNTETPTTINHIAATDVVAGDRIHDSRLGWMFVEEALNGGTLVLFTLRTRKNRKVYRDATHSEVLNVKR